MIKLLTAAVMIALIPESLVYKETPDFGKLSSMEEYICDELLYTLFQSGQLATIDQLCQRINRQIQSGQFPASLHAKIPGFYTQWGFAREVQGYTTESLKLNEKALALFKETSASTVSDYYDRSHTVQNLSRLHAARGKLREANQLGIEAIRIAEQTSATHDQYIPKAALLLNQANVLTLLGELREATRLYDEASSTARWLKSKDSDLNTQNYYRQEYADAHNGLGELYRFSGDHARAVVEFSKARNACDYTLQFSIGPRKIFEYDFACAQLSLGKAQRADKETSESLALMEEALRSLHELVLCDGTNSNWAMALAYNYAELASVKYHSTGFAEGLAYAREAVAHVILYAESDPQNIDYSLCYAEALIQLADLLSRRKEKKEARDYYELALTQVTRFPEKPLSLRIKEAVALQRLERNEESERIVADLKKIGVVVDFAKRF